MRSDSGIRATRSPEARCDEFIAVQLAQNGRVAFLRRDDALHGILRREQSKNPTFGAEIVNLMPNWRCSTSACWTAFAGAGKNGPARPGIARWAKMQLGPQNRSLWERNAALKTWEFLCEGGRQKFPPRCLRVASDPDSSLRFPITALLVAKSSNLHTRL
jgi:hypothetical protein